MRLICPNCGAQYDVSDDAIPKGGRDVQCSNCTNTWFQTDKPIATKVTSKGLLQPVPMTPEESIPSDDVARATVAPPSPSPVPRPKSPEMGSGGQADHSDGPRHRPSTPIVPNPLNSAVAEILRDEARREGHVPGGGNSKPPATQAPRTGAAIDVDETRKRIALMTEQEGGRRSQKADDVAKSSTTDEAIKTLASGGGTTPNLRAIPDINEINAALRARAEASDTSGLNADEKREAVQRRGFRRGFFGVLVLIALAITPYFFASEITEALPQTQSYMASYVLTIDQARVWLETQLGGLLN